MVANRIRLSLEVSPELNETLEGLAARIHGTKSEVLRRAIALMEVAIEAARSGQKLAIADKDDRVVTKIIGI